MTDNSEKAKVATERNGRVEGGININPDLSMKNAFHIFITEPETADIIKRQLKQFDKDVAENWSPSLINEEVFDSISLRDEQDDNTTAPKKDQMETIENNLKEEEDIFEGDLSQQKFDADDDTNENPLLPIEIFDDTVHVKSSQVFDEISEHQQQQENVDSLDAMSHPKKPAIVVKKDSGIELIAQDKCEPMESIEEHGPQLLPPFSTVINMDIDITDDTKKKDLIKESTSTTHLINNVPTINSKLSLKRPTPLNQDPKNKKLLASICAIFKAQTSDPIQIPESSTPSKITENSNYNPENYTLTIKEFEHVTKYLMFPVYLNSVFFKKCLSAVDHNDNNNNNNNNNKVEKNDDKTKYNENNQKVSFKQFSRVWDLLSEATDETSMIFKLLAQTPTSRYLLPIDFEPVLYELVDRHPGISFLKSEEHKEFMKRYVETVITRIYFLKRNNCNEKMSIAEFRNSSIIKTLTELESLSDINMTRSICSYKHFYVIYCKFWTFDNNHDMFIEDRDFYDYDNASMTRIVIDRVLSGAGHPISPYALTSKEYKQYKQQNIEKNVVESSIMPPLITNTSSTSTVAAKPTTQTRKFSYCDYVHFILANEDKGSNSGIEYWFRVLDTDGDGVLSMYELKPFWEQQYQRMAQWRIGDPWPFDDFICVMIDLIKPKDPCRITVSDLKKNRDNAVTFFNMLFDIQKYEHSLKRFDPLFREFDDLTVINSDGSKTKLEGWEKYAERTYEILVQEEGESSNRNNTSQQQQQQQDQVVQANYKRNSSSFAVYRSDDDDDVDEYASSHPSFDWDLQQQEGFESVGFR